MELRFLLDIILCDRMAILEQLAIEDQVLLVSWRSLRLLNCLLEVLNGVFRVNIDGERLAGCGDDNNLHGVSCVHFGFYLLNLLNKLSVFIYRNVIKSRN